MVKFSMGVMLRWTSFFSCFFLAGAVWAQGVSFCSSVFAEEGAALWRNPALPPKLFETTRKLRFEDIHYQILGSLRPGEEPLILIHGANSSLETFLPLAQALTSQRPVIVFDARGSGKTREPGAGYDVDVLAADLLVLMDGLNIPKAVLHGHSAGGTTALAFAAKNPQRVRALSLEDMSGMPYKGRNDNNMIETKSLIQRLRHLAKVYKTKDEFLAAGKDIFQNRSESFTESMLQKSLTPDGQSYSPHKAAAIEELMMDVGTRDLSAAYTIYDGPIFIMKADKTSRSFEGG